MSLLFFFRPNALLSQMLMLSAYKSNFLVRVHLVKLWFVFADIGRHCFIWVGWLPLFSSCWLKCALNRFSNFDIFQKINGVKSCTGRTFRVFGTAHHKILLALLLLLSPLSFIVSNPLHLVCYILWFVSHHHSYIIPSILIFNKIVKLGCLFLSFPLMIKGEVLVDGAFTTAGEHGQVSPLKFIVVVTHGNDHFL